jgi:hypothetical protein
LKKAGVNEPSTKIEDELFKRIRDHLIDNVSLDSKSAAFLKDLLKSGYYTNIIKAPKSDAIFRGMGVAESFMKAAMPQEKTIKPYGISKKQLKFKPILASKATSWSSEIESAKNFAQTKENMPYAILLKASVDRNHGSLLDMSGFYDVESFENFSNENEVLAIGDVIVDSVAWASQEALENGQVDFDELLVELGW